jgi:very-short-patch-repair endonuclease
MLRNRHTPWEWKLWQHLKNRRFHGYKFRRQTGIGNYIVDFVCLELRLIIELDGGGHLSTADTNQDYQRQKELESWGYVVIRYYNTDIDKNLDGVLEDLALKCEVRRRELFR